MRLPPLIPSVLPGRHVSRRYSAPDAPWDPDVYGVPWDTTVPAGLVPCDVLPLWHAPGECPTTFLCPTPKEA